MALIPCPECGTQISDRAPTCPKCGMPIASQPSPPISTPTPQISATDGVVKTPPSQELTFYSDNRGVRVTNTRAIMGNRTYSMANLSSVTLWKVSPNNTWPVLFIIFGLLQGIACISMKGMQGVSALGFILLVIGIAWLSSLKTTYFVRITAAGGDTNALGDKDYNYIKGVVDALNEAIVKRG